MYMTELSFTTQERLATPEQAQDLYHTYRDVLKGIISGALDIDRDPAIVPHFTTTPSPELCDANGVAIKPEHAAAIAMDLPGDWIRAKLGQLPAAPGVSYAAGMFATTESLSLSWVDAHLTPLGPLHHKTNSPPGVPAHLYIGFTDHSSDMASLTVVSDGSAEWDENRPAGLSGPRPDASNALSFADGEALSSNEYHTLKWVAGAVRQALTRPAPQA